VEFHGILIVKKTCAYQVHHSGPNVCMLIGFIHVDGGCVFIGFAAGDLCLCLLPQSSFFGGYKIFIFLLCSVFITWPKSLFSGTHQQISKENASIFILHESQHIKHCSSKLDIK